MSKFPSISFPKWTFRVRAAPPLRPTDARHRRLGGEYLARSCPVFHVLKTTPLGSHHEQRLPVYPSEHASEAATVKLDGLQYLATFSHAHATLVRDIPIPDGAFGVEADAVRGGPFERGPYPPVRQAPVAIELEGGKHARVGLGDDQRLGIGRHCHTIGESEAIGHQAHRSIGGGQTDNSGSVKAAAVDVDVAATIHDDLVPDAGKSGENGMGHKLPVELPAPQKPLEPRADETATISHPADAKWN